MSNVTSASGRVDTHSRNVVDGCQGSFGTSHTYTSNHTVLSGKRVALFVKKENGEEVQICFPERTYHNNNDDQNSLRNRVDRAFQADTKTHYVGKNIFGNWHACV